MLRPLWRIAACHLPVFLCLVTPLNPLVLFDAGPLFDPFCSAVHLRMLLRVLFRPLPSRWSTSSPFAAPAMSLCILSLLLHRVVSAYQTTRSPRLSACPYHLCDATRSKSSSSTTAARVAEFVNGISFTDALPSPTAPRVRACTPALTTPCACGRRRAWILGRPFSRRTRPV
jgi:hypothetical protein